MMNLTFLLPFILFAFFLLIDIALTCLSYWLSKLLAPPPTPPGNNGRAIMFFSWPPRPGNAFGETMLATGERTMRLVIDETGCWIAVSLRGVEKNRYNVQYIETFEWALPAAETGPVNDAQ
jgi:hypothetical protein